MFSCEFCKISENTFFAEHFRTPASVQYIPHLAEKGIYCRENPEAAAVGVLLKKANNFIKNDFSIQYCEMFKNTYLEKHPWMVAIENQHQIFRRKTSFLTF